jgi:hypothetical protein
VDDVLDDAADVTVLLGKVERTEARRGLVQVRVRLEDAARLTLVLDNTSHGCWRRREAGDGQSASCETASRMSGGRPARSVCRPQRRQQQHQKQLRPILPPPQASGCLDSKRRAATSSAGASDAGQRSRSRLVVRSRGSPPPRVPDAPTAAPERCYCVLLHWLCCCW